MITAVASLALYEPFGVGGIVAATAIATAASVVAQCVILRRELGGLELGAARPLDRAGRSPSAALAGVSYVVWDAARRGSSAARSAARSSRCARRLAPAGPSTWRW